ncbi:MAG: helix-turn-helix domain-containing protein [Vicinamibacteria bacterium]
MRLEDPRSDRATVALRKPNLETHETGRCMAIQRAPSPALRPFVKLLWASDEKKSESLVRVERERLLPTGAMHLVFRLCEHPIRIFNSIDDYQGQLFGVGVVGGIRSGFYVKDISKPVRTVGALLQPGASRLLFGAQAHELVDRHTPIQDLWGNSSRQLWERLQEAGNLRKQLEVFELCLAQRLPRVCGIHPAIAHALSRFSATTDIGEIVEETGYSHRRFIEIFRRTVGLAPRLYCRVLRFQQALKVANRRPRVSWIDVALESGYSDQAHFNREFREFTGISPGEYRLTCIADTHHVPLLPKG